MDLLIAIPVKPFGVAKARLAGVLSAAERSQLGKAVARRTVSEARRTGATVAVVTGSETVARWAREIGAGVVPERQPGLDGAAHTASEHAGEVGLPWMILHADLPIVTTADLVVATTAWDRDRVVIAPSHDGGTSLLMGTGRFPFSYGAGSFHRHLAQAAGRAMVVVRTGLALDLDTPRDLVVARELGLTTWQASPA